jgi:hypothetical protein
MDKGNINHMDAEIPSSTQIPRQLPIVKTGSTEWFGDSLRPDLQMSLVILLALAVLTGILLVIVPAQLRALALDTQIQTASDLATSSQNSASCVPRSDWAAYPLQPDDSLSELSRRTGVSLHILTNSNCLESTDVQSGNVLYIPAVPNR